MPPPDPNQHPFLQLMAILDHLIAAVLARCGDAWIARPATTYLANLRKELRQIAEAAEAQMAQMAQAEADEDADEDEYEEEAEPEGDWDWEWQWPTPRITLILPPIGATRPLPRTTRGRGHRPGTTRTRTHRPSQARNESRRRAESRSPPKSRKTAFAQAPSHALFVPLWEHTASSVGR